MKPILLLTILNCCCALLVQANPQEAEIRRLVSSEIGHLYRVGQALEGRWVEAGQGGYILRAQVDLTGDRKPELLLSTTMSEHLGLTTWHIYEKTADGTVRSYVDTLLLPIGSYQPARDPAGDFVLLQYDRHARELAIQKFKEWRVETQVVSDAEIEQLDESHFCYDYETKWPYQQFPVEALKVSDYVSGNGSWRTIDHQLVVMPDEGYFLSTADAEEMKSNKDFTPEVALRMLRSLPPTAAGSPDNHGDQPPGTVPGGTSQSATAEEEGGSLFTSAWAGLWAGLCLVAVAAFLWFRKVKGGRL